MPEVEQETIESTEETLPARKNLASATPAGSSKPERPRSQTFHPLLELTAARVREFLREPEVIFWVFVFPILLVFALGIAFRNTGPERVRVAVERSETDNQATPALIQALSQSKEIEVLSLSPAEAAQSLRSGRVALVVRSPDGATAQDRNSIKLSPSYRFDPTRPESQQARRVVDDALQRAAGRTDVISARDETFTEPGARYIDFLIPGLLGMNLMGSGLWGVGFAVVTARTRKLLKRFAATPMRRAHYLLSFVLSRMIWLVLEVIAVIAFAYFTFGFTVRGSFLEMSLVLLLGALTFSGIGLLVAARPKTIEGVSGLMNLVMMPMWLLSGTFFSSSRFPEFLQPFIKALPLTALNDSLRSVMNDGVSMTTNWTAILVMLAWCVISFILALKIFRWQ